MSRNGMGMGGWGGYVSLWDMMFLVLLEGNPRGTHQLWVSPIWRQTQRGVGSRAISRAIVAARMFQSETTRGHVCLLLFCLEPLCSIQFFFLLLKLLDL